MSVTIGEIFWMIRGNNDKLPGDLGKSEQQVKGFGQRVGYSLKKQMNIAAGQIMAGGITQITDGIKSLSDDLIQTTQEYANQVDDLSRLTGSSAEDTSRMIQVADDMKVEYGDLSTALTMYSRKQADAGGETRISTETLSALSDQYLKLAPGIERNNFLLQNFGRGGMAMAKLMEQGGASIREMSASMDESMILTEENRQAAEDYRVALDNWDDSITGLKLTLGKELLPVLSELLGVMTDTLIPILKIVVEGFRALPQPLQTAIIGMGALLVIATQLFQPLMGIVGVINLLGGGGALARLGGGFAAFAAAAAPWVALVAAIGLVFATLYNNFQTFIKILPKASTAAQQLVQLFQIMASNLGRTLSSLFSGVGMNIIQGIGKGLQAGWNWLVSMVGQISQSLLTSAKRALGIRSPSSKFKEQVGAMSAEGIGEGFRERLKSVASGMQSDVRSLPATAMAGALGGSVSVGTVEYHGSFSDEERDWFDKRSKKNAGTVIGDLFKK